MTYDWLSRKLTMSDPDMSNWSYTYDNNGNLQTQTDALSHTITMSYDSLNRLTGKTYPGGLGMTNVSYGYDDTSGGNYGKGRRTSISDALGSNSATFKYDTRGRLSQENKVIDSVTYTTGYTYDPADRIYQITYPTTEVVTNGYNGRGLPYSVSGGSAGTVVGSTLYNALGSITDINMGSTTVLKTTFGYYGTGGGYDTSGGYYGRLWEIKTTKQPGSTPVLQDVKHIWDARSNLTQRQDLVTGETENFTYDPLDRLMTAGGAYSEAYSYNEIGNITSKNGISYTYGDSNHKHAVTAIGPASYVYDSNGNMTNRGNQAIGWDVENRMVSATTGGASFIYDGDGNRVKKTEGGQTTVYINKYYEKNVTSGIVTTHYFLGDRQIALRQGSTLNYTLQDHLTGTFVISDSGGNSAGTIRYFPFGPTRFSTGTIPTDKKFTGQRLDSTGLYYYGARYYDPAIGRFISPDTVVPKFYNPQTLNRYSYCLNNPLKFIDPNGRDSYDWGAAWGMWYAYMATGDAGIYAYYSQCSFSGYGAGTSDTSTSITVSGTVTLSANRSVITDLTEPPEPGSMEIGSVNRSIPGIVTGVGGGSSALDTYLYYYSFLRTYQTTQTISFSATLSFNSDTGIARYNLDIKSSSPEYYKCTPYLIYNGVKTEMSNQVAWNSLNNYSFASTQNTYLSIPGGIVYDIRSTYLSDISMQLSVDYGNATNGNPAGVNIFFNRGTWEPY